MSGDEWTRIPLTENDLSLKLTLFCGQSFRWRETTVDEWSCTLAGRVVTVRQDDQFLYFRAVFSSAGDGKAPTEPTEDVIRRYFNLGSDLPALYRSWGENDVNFAGKAAGLGGGIRLLQQDPWETVVGFICSSNNNISRISKMMASLCSHFGTPAGDVGDHQFFCFPSPELLCQKDTEEQLRQLGFGYRARYLHHTAVAVTDRGGLSWLATLANVDAAADHGSGQAVPDDGRDGYQAAHAALVELSGIGPKVADCICLMGLGWGEALPVDTHVWQIAVRDYRLGRSGRGQSETMTKRTYALVAGHFRQMWGVDAGWAHSVLFTADLRAVTSVKAEAKLAVGTEIKTDGEAAVQTKQLAGARGGRNKTELKTESSPERARGADKENLSGAESVAEIKKRPSKRKIAAEDNAQPIPRRVQPSRRAKR